MNERYPEDELNVWLQALMAHGCNPKRSGDQYQALCPSHDDVEPSLTVGRGDKRPVVVNCFAGCGFTEIRDALGIKGSSKPSEPRAPRPADKPKKAPRKRKNLPTGHVKLRDGREADIVATYRYSNSAGEVVFAVQRLESYRDDGKRSKDFWQWTRTDDGYWIPKGPKGNRPLWRLPELMATAETLDSVMVVEGEKCVQAVEAAWPGRLVTTWAGGAQVWRKTDWAPLAGREVTVCADGDWDEEHQRSNGHLCATQIADHLVIDHACTVWLVLPPTDGTDIADWLIEGKQYTVDMVMKHRVKHIPKAMGPRAVVDNTGDPEPPDTPIEVELFNNEFYQVMGVDEHGKIVVRLKHKTPRTDRYTPRTLFKDDGLREIAPDDLFWSPFTREGVMTTVDARRIGSSIVYHAQHRLGLVDESNDRGRGAARLEDGSVVYHLGDRLLVDGEERYLDSTSDARWLPGVPIKLGKPSPPEHATALAKSVMKYRFQTPDHARRLMGWMASAIAGGALKWRPHASIVAPAESGKSWLLEYVLEKIMGPLVLKVADTSVAALARKARNDSLPIIIDEAEPTKASMMAIVEHLRIASGGDALRLRADPQGEGVSAMTARYSALLAATKLPQLTTADKTRITPIRFGVEVDDWPSLEDEILACTEHADGIRAYLVHQVPTIVNDSLRLSREFKEVDGLRSREADMTAALTAGWLAFGVDDHIVYSESTTGEVTDQSDAIQEILAIPVPTGGGTHTSLMRMVCNPQTANMAADLYGVRRDEEGEGGGLYVAHTHNGLKNALRRTSLEHVDLRSLLMQLDGAYNTKNQLWFGPIRHRAIHIPTSTLMAMGIEVKTPPARFTGPAQDSF